MVPRCRQSFHALGKMNLLERFPPRPRAMISWQQSLDITVTQILQGMKEEPAKNALRQSFGRRVDRRDSPKMNRELIVIFDHLKFWMFHADALTAKTRLPENDESLTGRDHLLDVVQIEPAEHE